MESHLYKIVSTHLEEFYRVYDQRYARTYGPLRPVVRRVFDRFLRCGDLTYGFARIKCTDCGKEMYVGYSCKTRGFCPSCQKKRAVEFAEFVTGEVMENVPHRQAVLSVPIRLRGYFRRNGDEIAGIAPQEDVMPFYPSMA